MRMEAPTRVTCIDTQFLYIHRMSLVAIGLWPYHRTMLVQFQSCVFSLTTISCIIFQLTTFLTTEWTIDFIVEVLSVSLFTLLCAIQYNSLWINMHVVKRLMEHLQYMCSDLKDENEIAIIKRYGHIAKCVAIVLASQYVAGGTLLGTGILVAGYSSYFCGFCSIASYRIEHAMRINSDEVTKWKNKREIDKKISHAVVIHRTAFEFTNLFIYNFEGTYLLIIAIIVICLSLHLFGIFQAVYFIYSMENFILHCSFTIGILGCSLGGNFLGQAITDHYNYIFSTAYNVRWYVAPVRVQRLILFLLQRGAKPYDVKFGGLYTTSLENFATLSTASISYFTVMCSIQK
ncbi:uncharacterized protein LOC105280138 isoform X4 [Ooceraea biroi]|uniref:uncharacterized protein LOC105280138 isoform X4 n=1 Tax=Ooceraea biroi TaxID=2015173 RepID=UPI000F086F62|nr:uncharacterized protein LOC105280138 isoform X4 [Ooceraea biroi]